MDAGANGGKGRRAKEGASSSAESREILYSRGKGIEEGGEEKLRL